MADGSYIYFDFGKIRSIEHDAIKESYTYDHEGRRIRKENETSEKVESFNYLLDDSGLVYNVLAEYDDVLHATSIYIYGTDIISIENNGETSYYLTDGQGSTRALTNENGIITDIYTFDAFGNILEQTGDTYNPYLYNQEQYDANTCLYYLRNRYMNPSTGRFVSMDSYAGSIYDPVSLHKYLYANGNPAMYIDPTGYKTLKETLLVMAAWSILGSITGSVVGGFSGGVIAKLSGASDEEVDEAIGKGFVQGGLIGAGTGMLYGGAICGSAFAAIVLTEFDTYFTSICGISTAEAYLDENYGLAGYMGAMTLISVLGTVKSYKVTKANLTNGVTTYNDGYTIYDDLPWYENQSNGNLPGRAKNNIKPYSEATGDHVVYKIDSNTGEITNYKVYKVNPQNPFGFDEVIGYDGVGKAHKNPVTEEYLMPHVHDNTSPGKTRKPFPNEIPD